ncbi:MAG: nucleotidyltransferase family protein [Candidatus Latescibacteria bacterium]|nr:nucleotidyltransferase family protein [Candidatus Latescibacterota bacterium]
MNLLNIVKENRDEILRIASQHGASDVRIFGSVVRGEDTESSDIDLLVEFEKNRSLLDHADMIIEMEDLLGCKVDVVTEPGLKERVKARVLTEAVPL